jgi:hypothetical protein
MNNTLPTEPEQSPPESEAPETDTRRYHVFRLRRRSLAEWLAWLVWFVLLIVFLEYAITSFAEYERQAAIVAGAIFVGLLAAGIIIEVVKSIEIRSPYYYELNESDEDDG